MTATLGCGFLGIAACIVWKQKKAATCELHDRTAGQVAMVLAVLAAVAGVSLIVTSIIL